MHGSLQRAVGCALLAAAMGVAGVTAGSLEGCGRPSSRQPEVRFGIEHNSTRKLVGLPLVNPEWRTATLDNETLVWSSPFGAQRGEPSHYDKVVVFDRGEIVEEVDFYTNGRPYTLDDPGAGRVLRLESVVIHYNYEKAARGAPPWSCALTRSSNDEEISLEEAEQVLTSWGVPRLDR